MAGEISTHDNLIDAWHVGNAKWVPPFLSSNHKTIVQPPRCMQSDTLQIVHWGGRFLCNSTLTLQIGGHQSVFLENAIKRGGANLRALVGGGGVQNIILGDPLY